MSSATAEYRASSASKRSRGQASIARIANAARKTRATSVRRGASAVGGRESGARAGAGAAGPDAVASEAREASREGGAESADTRGGSSPGASSRARAARRRARIRAREARAAEAVWARRESNPQPGLRPGAFKTPASAVPPLARDGPTWDVRAEEVYRAAIDCRSNTAARPRGETRDAAAHRRGNGRARSDLSARRREAAGRIGNYS